MSCAKKSEGTDLPITTAKEVRQAVGDIDDETVARILRLQPSWSELEFAVTYSRGEGDQLARIGHPLTGKAAQLYEILRSLEVTLPSHWPSGKFASWTIVDHKVERHRSLRDDLWRPEHGHYLEHDGRCAYQRDDECVSHAPLDMPP